MTPNPRYNFDNTNLKCATRLVNADAIIEKIHATSVKVAVSLRATGDSLPQCFDGYEPDLRVVEQYLQGMANEAIESVLEADDQLEDDKPGSRVLHEVEKGVAGDDVFQVEAFIDGWHEDLAQIHIDIIRVY